MRTKVKKCTTDASQIIRKRGLAPFAIPLLKSWLLRHWSFVLIACSITSIGPETFTFRAGFRFKAHLRAPSRDQHFDSHHQSPIGLESRQPLLDLFAYSASTEFGQREIG